MRDWRRRCFQNVDFGKFSNVLESRLANVGALLLCCSEIECKTINKIFDVSGAFIPLCPFQESPKVSLFSSAHSSVKNFLTNAILPIVSKSKLKEV